MKKKILAIDDESSHLRLLQKALSARGYDIFVTSDPKEAFETLKAHEINLVVLDIRMPEKGGFELYGEFEAYQEVPVLFVTGFPEEFTTKSEHLVSMWKNQFSKGTTDILYKPFDLDALYEKVESLIGK
ncbi:MAG: response regulator [Kiritimatiellae bacterium]|nr:response regulator [Kiritimatiellia bacterium]